MTSWLEKRRGSKRCPTFPLMKVVRSLEPQWNSTTLFLLHLPSSSRVTARLATKRQPNRNLRGQLDQRTGGKQPRHRQLEEVGSKVKESYEHAIKRVEKE